MLLTYEQGARATGKSTRVLLSAIYQTSLMDNDGAENGTILYVVNEQEIRRLTRIAKSILEAAGVPITNGGMGCMVFPNGKRLLIKTYDPQRDRKSTVKGFDLAVDFPLFPIDIKAIT